MNITAELKGNKGDAWVRITSVRHSPALHGVNKRFVVLATKDFEIEVDADELTAAIQACIMSPKYAFNVLPKQFVTWDDRGRPAEDGI